MDITLSLDEHEVTALRSGSHIPVSLRDKLSDAVEIRDVGWYLVKVGTLEGGVDARRAVWWDGNFWKLGSVPTDYVATVTDPDDAQRLYLDEER